MKLPKLTFGNGVKYNPYTNSSASESSHVHKPKTASNPGKQIKRFSQFNEKFIKDIITGEGIRILKWIINCYFWLKSMQIHWLKKQKRNHKKHLNLKWTSKWKLSCLILQ